jgi:two-component system, NtrC family, sensor kinase
MPTSSISFWNRLGVRLAAVVTLVAAVTIGIFAWATNGAYERQLVDQVVRDAALFSETIKSSVYYDMLANRREDAYRIVSTIGRQPGIEVVRFFNKEGRVTFSTDASEVGTLVDKNAESCYACHAANQPITRLTIPSRSRTYQRGGRHVLGMVTPIYNEAACSNTACHEHPSSQSVLGVVDIGLSLAEVDQTTASLRRTTLLLAAATMLVLAVIVSVFLRRRVARRVVEVVRATDRFASGEHAASVPVRYQDEIGLLATSFNKMTHSLDETQERLRDLMASLERQVDERTAALRQTQAQLVQSEKLSSLGRMAASVAHEINNPLTGILTYTKLLIRLMESKALDAAARDSAVRQLSLVQRETERCTEIVRNLLDFARQRPLTIKDVSLEAVVQDALALLAHKIDLQNVKIERRFAPVPAVRGDEGQLRQAFVNIALNACDAMTGGGVLTVEIRSDGNGENVVVEFTDTGPGIPSEHLAKIFEPFFTTKQKGTGLGLSVVYGIVERHGGKLDVDSQTGRGTTVRIRLAAAKGSEGAANV